MFFWDVRLRLFRTLSGTAGFFLEVLVIVVLRCFLCLIGYFFEGFDMCGKGGICDFKRAV